MVRPLCKILSILLVTGVVSGCGSDNVTVELDSVPTAQSVAVPLEVDTAAVDGSPESVYLTRAEGGEGGVELERSAAIFSASDDRKGSLPSSYCGLMPAGESERSFESSSQEENPVAFAWVDQGGRLALVQGEDSVLTYNYGMQLPQGVPAEYERSSYVHPIWNLAGTKLTDDFPADHYHHRGLSWMWPRVFVDGQEYDLWALRGIEQRFDRWLTRKAGSACAVLGVKNHWEMMEDGRNVVDEWVWIRAYPAGNVGRAIDVRITLEANEPVEIAGRETADKGYGGFSLRYGPRDSTVIVSPEGREDDSDHRRLPWADESGLFRGSTDRSGIAVFQHVDHPDFPAQWTLRHYGFIGVAWPSLQRVSLNPGEPLTLRYRIWVHRGGAAEGRVAEAYRVFRGP